MKDVWQTIPACLQRSTALRTISRVIPLRMRLSISGFPVSTPKLTLSHPVSRMILSVSRSTVFARAKALQVNFSPRRRISSQTARTFPPSETNRSSATLIRVSP
ncbi:MAG: hypothetical protein A4E73_00048 [Syntrophaceae bacterium PtaU1.Bin231]|nr:MAG: hypothetical protein A4E73_00048 [Syntrophaceae bacterium PtaU1.Bin231]